MSINMKIWKVEDEKLNELPVNVLDSEKRLENWIVKNSSILGMDILIVGRQVRTIYNGIIDLIAIDDNGDLVILELKRDRTPRDVVAQILDYASWCNNLVQKDIETIAKSYLDKELSSAFIERFGVNLPEAINTNHSMVIIASQIDYSSQRIVEYLNDEYGVNINVVFFNYFKNGDEEYLGRSWLKDQQEVENKAEARKKGEWTGFWYVNINQNWDVCTEHSVFSASGARVYTDPLRHLKVGDPIFAYLRGHGYVGYGEVDKEVLPSVEYFNSLGKKLEDINNKKYLDEYLDDPDKCSHVVGVKWKKIFTIDNAKKYTGIFSNQHVVCKLRNQETLSFLQKEFEVE